MIFTPHFAYADAFTLIDTLIGAFNAFSALCFSLAIAAFFWGMVKFVANAGDERKLEDGKKMMVMGLIGIFVIFSIWAIVGWLQSSLGWGGGGGGSLPGVPTSL
jgi:hypothetical protein